MATVEVVTVAKRVPRTWAEVIVLRVGFRPMARVVNLLLTWAVVVEELDREPTVNEYAEWWGTPRGTAYRDLALWREALPEFATPGVFLAEVGTSDLRQRVPRSYVEGLA